METSTTKSIRNMCVYRHLRLDTGRPFYIGIGSSTDRAHSRKNRNQWWHHVTNRHGREVEIMLTDLTHEEACAKEIELIALYGRSLDGGILVNMSTGGKRWGLGVPHTPESKAKLSILNAGPANRMFGRLRPDIIAFNKESKSRAITAIEIATGATQNFPSQREAARQLGLDQSRIYLILAKRALSTGGYRFVLQPITSYEN